MAIDGLTAISPFSYVTDRGYSRNVRSSNAAAARAGTPLQRFKSLTVRQPGSSATDMVLSSLSVRAEKLADKLALFEFPSASQASQLRTATVSDNEKAAATVSSGATEKTYTLDIDSLATAQTARSSVMLSSAETSLAEGEHSFTVTIDDTDYSVVVTIDKSGSDPVTNKDVMQQVARAIRSTSLNLNVTVSEAERNAYSELSPDLTETVVVMTIAAAETGNDFSFSIQDSAGGSIVDTLGLDRALTPGSESQFTLNDVATSADSNSISTDSSRLVIDMLDTTGTPLSISVSAGIGPLAQNVGALVDDINGLLSFLGQHGAEIGPALKRDLNLIAQSLERDLRDIGIEVIPGGGLNVTDGFIEALATGLGTVRDTLSGTDGYFTQVAAKLDEVLANDIDEYAAHRKDPSAFTIDVYA